jgi:regulatory protein YycI of two-component signal transduction system YycFG
MKTKYYIIIATVLLALVVGYIWMKKRTQEKKEIKETSTDQETVDQDHTDQISQEHVTEK